MLHELPLDSGSSNRFLPERQASKLLSRNVSIPDLSFENRIAHDHDNSVEDASIRYVAEDNIGIIRHPNVALLMRVAGQYFKRYDQENCRFIANFKEEYPDD